MEIILTENVDNLGLRGDIVKVKDGYARNYLIPKGFAVEATSGNLKQMEQKKKSIEELRVRERGEAEEFKKTLESKQLEIVKKVGEKGVLYGAVTTQDIAALMSEMGYDFDRRKISTEEVIKTAGTFNVSVRVFPEITAVMKLRVYSEEEWAEVEAERAAAAAEKEKREAAEAEEEKKEASDKSAEADDEKSENAAGEDSAEENKSKDDK